MKLFLTNYITYIGWCTISAQYQGKRVIKTKPCLLSFLTRHMFMFFDYWCMGRQNILRESFVIAEDLTANRDGAWNVSIGTQIIAFCKIGTGTCYSTISWHVMCTRSKRWLLPCVMNNRLSALGKRENNFCNDLAQISLDIVVNNQ